MRSQDMKKTACFFLMAFLLLATPAFAESFTGKVLRVITGSTLTVVTASRTYDIRLCSIDCPDLDQEMGAQAKKYAEDLMLGKDVWVDVQSLDHSRRSVSRVLVDRKDVSVELAKAGFAWFDGRCSPQGLVAEAEADARDGKAGIWSQAAPQAPWDFRQAKRNINPDFSAGLHCIPGPSGSSANGFVPVEDQGCESCFKIYFPIVEADGSVSGYTEY